MSIASVSSVASTARESQAFTFLLCKSVPETGVVFEEVPESNLQLGDILLFLLGSSKKTLWGLFKHTAVCCGDGEVIHFTKRRGSSLGRISKEGLRAMKKNWGDCKVYRKNGGINHNGFLDKVKKAMNCEANYDEGENNCIHFALYLLGLSEFYMQLVKIKGDSEFSKYLALCEMEWERCREGNNE